VLRAHAGAGGGIAHCLSALGGGRWRLCAPRLPPRPPFPAAAAEGRILAARSLSSLSAAPRFLRRPGGARAVCVLSGVKRGGGKRGVQTGLPYPPSPTLPPPPSHPTNATPTHTATPIPNPI